MTSDNDFCMWRWHYRERHSRISVNAQTIACNAPRIRALITSRNDRHVWTHRNSFTGMSTKMIKNAVFFVFLSKNTHKSHEIVIVAVINDNNNFAPSLFRSLCEFVGDCFGPRYFSLGAALPQKNTSVQNNHLRFHTMTSKKMVRGYYCLSKTWFCRTIHTDMRIFLDLQKISVLLTLWLPVLLLCCHTTLGSKFASTMNFTLENLKTTAVEDREDVFHSRVIKFNGISLLDCSKWNPHALCGRLNQNVAKRV